MKLNLLPCKIRNFFIRVWPLMTFFSEFCRYGSDYAKNKRNSASQLSKTLETIVEKLREKFPRLVGVYSLVYGGTRGIFYDFKKQLELLSKLSKSKTGADCLSLEELEFYHSFKLCSRKLIPVSVLGVLPFGNLFIVPLVYFIPRKTVTHHFWTDHQKATFPIEEHKDRLLYHKPVLDYFKKCPSGRIQDDVLIDWRRLLEKLDEGARPEVSDVLKVSPLFHRNGPFYLQSLPKLHVIHLAASYGITSMLSPLGRIIQFAQLNKVIDKKIAQRGGPKALPSELRSKICYLKGVDSMNMSQEEQIAYLQKWLQLNAKIDISNYSLLLHTPILLGYNTLHTESNVPRKG